MKFLLLALTLALASCSDEKAEPSPTPAAAPAEVVDFIGGSVELTGRLAEDPAAGLMIVATAPGLATQLVSKVALVGLEKTGEGTLVVPFTVGSHSGMMASRAIAKEEMPAELSLKVSYTSNGFVEGIEKHNDVVVPAKLGDLDMQVRMEPQPAPASRPTSRATSRPVVTDE